jgi:hypothetical protein
MAVLLAGVGWLWPMSRLINKTRGNGRTASVKETAEQLQHRIAGIRPYGSGVDVDMTADDRGNDPLRKAKYLLKHRSLYFCGVAVGTRMEYRVDYPSATFRLVESSSFVIAALVAGKSHSTNESSPSCRAGTDS